MDLSHFTAMDLSHFTAAALVIAKQRMVREAYQMPISPDFQRLSHRLWAEATDDDLRRFIHETSHPPFLEGGFWLPGGSEEEAFDRICRYQRRTVAFSKADAIFPCWSAVSLEAATSFLLDPIFTGATQASILAVRK